MKLALAALALVALPALAQTPPSSAAPAAAPAAANNGQPIEIVARDGIEWHRDQQRYVARGNARATQGDKTVEAQILTAHYRQPEGGSTEIYRYVGEGSVRLSTPTQRAFGDHGVYDVETGVMVLTGKGLKITTPDQEITARDSLEYWELKNLAVARGNAVAKGSDGKLIRGDILTALFEPPPADAKPPQNPGAGAAQRARGANPLDASGSSQKLKRVEADGNVLVSTPEQIAQGQQGVYVPDSGIATLWGNVKLTRGNSQMHGDRLDINLDTGVYRLTCRDGTATCVRALYVPEKQDDTKPDPIRPGAPRR
jgi:lipopolysaccharide export system protein LptA